MLIRWGLKQSFRTPRRLAAYFLVTAVVCAFLCIGLNMKKTADDNLQNILNNFNILALPDFQAYIDEAGQLAVNLSESIGYLQCRAENYDIDALKELPGVIQVDVRNQFGACVDGIYPQLPTIESVHHYFPAPDVMVFQIQSSKPVTVTGFVREPDGRYYARMQNIAVDILWSAARQDLTLSNLRILNPSHTSYVLEPGKTYIVNLNINNVAYGDIYHNSDQIRVNENGAYYWHETYIMSEKTLYPPLTEYFEGFWDTDIGKYYRQSAEACYLNANSLTAVTTGDLNMIPAWSNGDIYLKNGHAFSSEDYENGSRVCIVSQYLLDQMSWELGDTIDFSFYESQYTLSRFMRRQNSFYDPYLFNDGETLESGENGDYPLDHFFDENTYTIIGTYDGQVYWRDDENYHYNESLHWQMVLFPETSIQNQPDPKLSQYHTTLRIAPLMVQKFLAAAQSSGLMDQQTYGYQLGLTIDDQGLSGMIAGLESLQKISGLILMLATITAVLAVLVLVILHLLQSRKQIAVLRSMGVKKGQTAVCVLSGILVVCLLGAALGAFAGQQLAVRATEDVFATAMEDTMDSSFSAMLVTDTDESDDFQLAAAAAPALTWWAAGVVAGAIVLLSLSLTLWETKKPPLLVLGVKE